MNIFEQIGPSTRTIGAYAAVGLLAGAVSFAACGGDEVTTGGNGGTGGTSAGGSGTGGSGTGGSNCGPGATLCGDTCTVTDFDPNNCGTCGNVCQQGEVCSQGQCGLTCGGGTTQCGDVCVVLDNDPANCGACGNACDQGYLCVSGQCAVSCEAGGGTDCSGQCVDLSTDPQHCGDCAVACQSGEICDAGQCVTSCGPGQIKCNSTCVNPQTDEQNCGGCGNACANNEDCVNGSCSVCDTSITDCDGDGWLVGDGDCCDKTGSCGLEPELVNPGAIEVVGNGIDDNCNGLTDLFDTEDTVPCDSSLSSNSVDPVDYAKAIGICRQTTDNPPQLQDKTWGLIEATITKADGTALPDARAHSIRTGFGSITPPSLEGNSVAVFSSGIAADGSQTNPGPNGGAPGGSNVSTAHTPANSADIATCSDPKCIKDWFTTANPPLKNANELPVAPNCGSGSSGNPETANDSVMLYLKLRAPTNAKAFSFNTYFFSAEYPEYVCTNYNDQFVALVDTPQPTSPIPNPVDKNLLTYNDGQSKWPIGINIASGTSLFSVCETQAQNANCWDTDVSSLSCALGAGQLAGTGFEDGTNFGTCTIGGGTYWLTTSGNIVPGDILELRIVVWDVGDSIFDSLALLDGFEWLSNATVPGTD